MNKKLALAALLVAILVVAFFAWRRSSTREDVALEPRAKPAAPAIERETVDAPVAVPDATPRELVTVEPSPAAAVQPAKKAAPPVPDAATTPMFVRIVDQANGLAIAGARIERSREEQPDLASDARGLCSFVFSRPKSFSMSTEHEGPLPRGFCRVHAPGFGPAEFHETEGHETEERALEIRLNRAATLAVTLLRRSDTSAGAYTVSATIDGGNLVQNETGASLEFDFSALRIDAACDAWGNARLEGLPADVDVALSVLHQGSVVWTKPDLVRMKAGEERALEITLGGGCRVRVHVVDANDASVPNIEVWLTRRGEYPRWQFSDWDKKDLAGSGRSDDAGKLDFGEISPGPYMLGLSPTPVQRYRPSPGVPPPRELTGINVEVEIADSDRTRDLEVRVQDGLFIEGIVYLPDGSKLQGPGVQIFCNSKGVGHQVMEFTKADGSFRCGPLLNARYVLQCGETGGYTGSQPVEADPGKTDVALVLRAGSRLVVRIVEFAGGPGVSAGLVLAYLDGSSTRTISGSTPGYYPLTGLAPGTVSLAAATADCRCGVLTSIDLLPGSSQEVELLLSPGANLRIRSSDGAKLGAIKITQGGMIVASPTGGYDSGQVQTCVPAGLLVVKRGKSSEQTVTLAAGEERELVFEP